MISVAWSPTDDRLASGSSDKTVLVWDAAKGEQVLLFIRLKMIRHKLLAHLFQPVQTLTACGLTGIEAGRAHGRRQERCLEPVG